MSRRALAATIATALAGIVVIGTVVSPALGGPGFLTAGKAKRIFFTKGAANKRFLTKTTADSTFLSKSAANSTFLTESAANSTFLTDAEAAAGFLPASGKLKLQVGDTDWMPAAGTGTVKYFADAVQLKDGTGGTACSFACALIAAPDIPVEILGRGVKVDSFELCYQTGPNATLTDVALVKQSTTTPGAAPPATPIDDPTARTDSACRTYSAASPVTIGPADDVKLSVVVSFANASATFHIYRTTLTLSVG